MWVWLSLLLGVCVEATSNGVALTCDVDFANLGNPARVKTAGFTMWWVLPPVFAGTQYTLTTADPSTAADPTGYVPGQWMEIFIRTNVQDKQFTGLLLYATNAQKMKVGEWEVPIGAPYHVMPDDNCVVHSNADPKNYVSVFKFKGPPVGTGTVTIKALIKFGLAFPSLTGTFFWPNSGHLTLTEKPQTQAQNWFEGGLGESCFTVCSKRGMGCDLPTMQAVGNNPASFLAKAAIYSNCSGRIMPGCSAASPNVGTAGCFYHSDTCVQPPAVTPNRTDLCAGLPAWTSGMQLQAKQCVTYKGDKWCIAYGGQVTIAPDNPDYAQQNHPGYGPWGTQTAGAGEKGTCAPAGGVYPPLPIPARVNSGAHAITCGATKDSVADGFRICACSPNGDRYSANSAPHQAVLPVAAFLLSVLASF